LGLRYHGRHGFPQAPPTELIFERLLDLVAERSWVSATIESSGTRCRSPRECSRAAGKPNLRPISVRNHETKTPLQQVSNVPRRLHHRSILVGDAYMPGIFDQGISADGNDQSLHPRLLKLERPKLETIKPVFMQVA
jgi:hypothetical protein